MLQPESHSQNGQSTVTLLMQNNENVRETFVFQWNILTIMSIMEKKMFTESGKTFKNSVWQQHNIKQECQVIRNGNMVPFNELKTQFGLKDSEFLSYLQIKSINRSLLPKGLDIGNKRDLEDILMGAAGRRGTVSAMYRFLLSLTATSKLYYNGNVT